MSWQVAQLIATEFFEQGDIEKAELKIKPQVCGIVKRYYCFLLFHYMIFCF